MRTLQFCLLLPAAWLLCACEPSPREAAEIFCRDLEKGDWQSCARLMTPELRASVAKAFESWPLLRFSMSYYTDEKKCEFLRYETRDGKAHTLVSYSWRFAKAPVPGSVFLDLVWRPADERWRIEDIYASSHFDMLLPVTAATPPEAAEKAHFSSSGFSYTIPYRGDEDWQSLGGVLENYLKNWYE